MECKSLRESGKELNRFDIVYFGASCDPLDKNKQFAEKLELTYPLLSDTDRSVAAAYGILRGKWSKRITIFVDKSGKIVHIESKVDVRNHGKQVVQQLEKLKFPLKSASQDAESPGSKTEAGKTEKTDSDK